MNKINDYLDDGRGSKLVASLAGVGVVGEVLGLFS